VRRIHGDTAYSWHCSLPVLVRPCHTRRRRRLRASPGSQRGRSRFSPPRVAKTIACRASAFGRREPLPASHITVIDGLAVTTLERTLFDLAGAINEKRADRAIENVLARRRTTIERLWDVWADLAVPRRPGVPVMRKLLLKRGPGYVARESELEIRFSELLDADGIAQPDWQVEIGDDEFIGRVDCLFRRARLLVELDGRIGHVGVLDEARDCERDRRLRALGYRVRRFTWEDVVFRPAWVICELRSELSAAA